MAYTTIDNGGEYFNIKTYSGNNVAETKSTEFQVDWLWIKCRNNARSHLMYDSTRGFGNNKHLVPNTTAVEDGDVDGGQVDQGERGFIGSNSSSGFYTNSGTAGMHLVNATSNTYVAWYWKANGGTTTTNDASSTGVGNVDSVYQANTTAGFSIVTFDLTGDSGDKTIAHGLGQAPDVIIFKNRDDARNWAMHHHTQTPPQYMTPNTTDAVASSDNFNNSTDPTSTVFSLETSWHGAHKHVAYCFAEVQGYSKFGTYKGNGNADGTFVYTGFKPAWLMYKQTNGGTRDWIIVDNKRDAFNVCDEELYANESDATGDVDLLDFVSNGFKCRRSHNSQNGNGDTYIYMAFAEHPFVSSEGVPTTAR